MQGAFPGLILRDGAGGFSDAMVHLLAQSPTKLVFMENCIKTALPFFKRHVYERHVVFREAIQRALIGILLMGRQLP